MIMWCCPTTETEQSRKNKAINDEIRAEKRLKEGEMKLLLLGAGESGKSTIAKQMKIIHLAGFTDVERVGYKVVIYDNIIHAIRKLIAQVRDMKLKLQPSNEEAANRLHVEGEPTAHFLGPINNQNVADILKLWQDPAIQQAYLRGHEFHLIDSAAYYFSNIERIGGTGYIPTEQDILRSRAKTTGIVETSFMADAIRFKMVDVGGQRSERRKWINCFQDVTAVIFCVALSEYDMKMYEDDTTNRMHESLKIFYEICNSEFFRETAMILFLNKDDIFKEKIARVNLKVCFDDFTGPPSSYRAGIDFISEKFLAQNQNIKKNVYIHVTCATDTECVYAVFNAVKDIVLRIALNSAGIL